MTGRYFIRFLFQVISFSPASSFLVCFSIFITILRLGCVERDCLLIYFHLISPIVLLVTILPLLPSWGSFFRSGSPFCIFSLFISFCVGLFVSYFALLLVLRFIFYFYLFIYFVVVLCSCSLYCKPAASAWDLGIRKFVFRKASGLWPGKPAA